MHQEKEENDNKQNAKVLKLGFNISVTGDSDADFEIVLDDKANVKSTAVRSENQYSGLHLENVPKQKVEWTRNKSSEVESVKMNETSEENSSPLADANQASTSHGSTESSGSKELSLINDIKTTMDHFEKFSNHIREIPRFRIGPIASSTPFPNKESSKSESNLIYPETRPRRFAHLYDSTTRREYLRGKPLPSDLFLKPLPGADLYRRGMGRSYAHDPLMMYGSVDSLTRSGNKYSSSSWKSNLEDEKYESDALTSGILKKAENNEGGEKSTSSMESVKDIKIYQNGGILIMQNFKETFDVDDKRGISDFSAKLIENCNSLKAEISGSNYPAAKPAIANSSGESQSSGKMVQFDLIESDYQKNKLSPLNTSLTSKEDSPSKPGALDLSEREFLLESQVCQDFLSMSTQENDSIVSNAPGLSPGASVKKLEWDSGADVGYLNLDLSKENLSTIERIVLRGLSNEGLEKNVVYEKKSEEPHYSSSKVILERKPSEVIIEEIVEVRDAWEKEKKSGNDSITGSDNKVSTTTHSENAKKDRKELQKKHVPDKNAKGVTEFKSSESEKPEPLKELFQHGKRSSRKQVKPIGLRNKSVNVNTLFAEGRPKLEPRETPKEDDLSLHVAPPIHANVKLPRTPPRHRKVKKKSANANIIGNSCKTSRENTTNVDSNLDVTPTKMGIPKKSYRNLEAKPELSDSERSREIEEIVVDQSLKSKDKLPELKQSVEDVTETTEREPKNHENLKRPLSGSSTKTVLSSVKRKDSKETNTMKNQLVDQVIQTNEYKVESIGIQAFSTGKSSNTSSSRHPIESEIQTEKLPKNVTNVSSKNVQAFGLNSSLPKALAHPKETYVHDTHNTKSTQFFGGSINSLPNYHSQLAVNPLEPCRRMFKVLKTKKSHESAVIDRKEDNKKNIMANDSVSKSMPTDSGDVPEDKENLQMVEPGFPGKDRNDFKKNFTRKGMSNDVKEPVKSRTESEASVTKLNRESERSPSLSDSLSCNVLTTKHLKEHGDSIDRSLIQDMYFQSQLVQLERRKMVSKSTSMDFLREDPAIAKKVTVACQYSTRSKDSEEESQGKDRRDCTDDKGYGPKSPDQFEGCPEDLDDEHNGTSKCTVQDSGTGDSFPSSTQTASSWVPHRKDSRKNNVSAVGRARSFEYLPGDIYECNGNLREKLPSENGENVTTDSSSDCSGGSAKESGRTGTDGGSSEGRKTLVLENSKEDSWDSGQLKSLEENLTQLNIVVTRLREKDDQIRRITRSVLVNLWRHNGSGDATGHLDTPETKINDRRDARLNQDAKKEKFPSKNSSDEEFSGDRNIEKALERKEIKKPEGDVSIGCQTEDKSDKSSLEKYQNERNALETRLAADKESQIKWIEKEIYHLNILRGILEKQSSLTYREKKSTNTEMSEVSKNNDKNHSKDVHVGDYPRPVTPVYGCTVSLLENNLEANNSPSENSNSLGRNQVGEKSPMILNDTKYGMAVSLNGNLRRVMLLPVGVQVSMNNADLNGNCLNDDTSEQKTRRHTRSRPTSRALGPDKAQCFPAHPSKQLQSDAVTQYPSIKKPYCDHPSTSIQVDLSPHMMKDCGHCQQKNCVCLSLSHSGKSDASTDRYSKVDRTLSERQGSMSRQGLDGIVPVNQSVGQKTMSNISGTDTLNGESLLESSHRCSGKSNERSLNSTAINSSDKGALCRCENCPRRSISKPSNSKSEQSQSTTHYHHRKVLDDSSKASCQCSKVQMTKSSACHVIKIVGSTCCGPESGTCSCKRRNLKKTSQNQSSQTDDIVIENKDLVTSAELVKPDKGPNVVWPLEGKTAIDRRHSVDEKYLCNPRPSYDTRQPQLAKIGLQEKSALQKQTPEDQVSMDVKTAVQSCLCDCQKKKEKEKQKTDDHPRHYFLKIEETEMDESSELMERRRSLEVITVTVPVKKAGKAKIYGNDIKQSSATKQQINPSRIQGKSGCTCCKDCIGQKLINYSHNYPNRCQKLPAEKPDSYRKRDHNYETESFDGIEPCTEEINFNECYNPSSSSLEDYSRPKTDYTNPGQSHGKQGDSENQTADGYFRSRMTNYSRETSSDYDSHKEYRPQKSCHLGSEDKGKKGPVVDRYVAEEPFERTTDSRTFKTRKKCPDWNQYDSDYYNYDKREFKTKSELLREEQKTKKEHQPSLQEYLERNRPDFCNSAESRRRIISERAEERAKNHGNRMECLMNLMHQCNSKNEGSKRTDGTKRIFTTPQMKEQTMKRYRQLPEVTEKVADQKKKEEYRTNKLMADIFAKKLQLEALKGHINLSNSVSVLSTI